MRNRGLSLLLVGLGIFSILSINDIKIFSLEFLFTIVGITLIVIGNAVRD